MSRSTFPPPKRLLEKFENSLLGHLDNRGKVRSNMRLVMSEVEHFARLEYVWLKSCWTISATTTIRSTIWPHLQPYLSTLT